MYASKRILVRLGITLSAVSILSISAVCTAGPMGLGTHKASSPDGPHVLSLASLRPSLVLGQRPQTALDAPRLSMVNLHGAQARLPASEDSTEAVVHHPQGLHWQDGSAPISPNLVSLARNYHREGLPVVRLWQQDRNMVSIGLNPHGVPGIYFTQKMGR